MVASTCSPIGSEATTFPASGSTMARRQFLQPMNKLPRIRHESHENLPPLLSKEGGTYHRKLN